MRHPFGGLFRLAAFAGLLIVFRRVEIAEDAGVALDFVDAMAVDERFEGFVFAEAEQFVGERPGEQDRMAAAAFVRRRDDGYTANGELGDESIDHGRVDPRHIGGCDEETIGFLPPTLLDGKTDAVLERSLHVGWRRRRDDNRSAGLAAQVFQRLVIRRDDDDHLANATLSPRTDRALDDRAVAPGKQQLGRAHPPALARGGNEGHGLGGETGLIRGRGHHSRVADSTLGEQGVDV